MKKIVNLKKKMMKMTVTMTWPMILTVMGKRTIAMRKRKTAMRR